MPVTNTYARNSVVLNEFLVEFVTELQFLKTAGRDFTQNYKNAPLRKGDTLYYRLPYNFTVGHSLTVTPQPVEDRVRPIKVDKLSNIALEFDGYDITFEDVYKDPFKKERMAAQVRDLANDKEKQIGIDFASSTYLSVGKPGQPVTKSTLGLGRAMGLSYGIPFLSKTAYAGLNVDVANDLSGSVDNVFNTTVNRAALEKGFVGALKGFDIFETVYLPRHISGLGAAGVVVDGEKSAGHVNGQVSTGNTIAVDGLANEATVFRKGDIIKIAGVYGVSFDTLQATKHVAQFRVTEDVVSNAAGQASVPVFPAIIASGPYQNVSGALPDNAEITMFDDHDVGILYVSDALVYAQPGLAPLKNAVKSLMSYSDKYRMAMTLTAGSDVTNYFDLERVDILSGWAFNPELAIRVISN